MVEMDCAIFILATLLNSGGKFESATKLQKLAFLSIYENGMDPFTNFKWHHYGPYSKELQDTVNILTEEGLVNEETIERISYSGNLYTVKRLTLTPEGRAKINDEIDVVDEKSKVALVKTLAQYGNKPLARILDYVYKAYNSQDFIE